MKYKEKQCVICGTIYLPTGFCSKYCEVCKEEATKETHKKSMRNWNIRNGIYKGVGSGSATGSGENNFMFSHGQCTFRRWAKERKVQIGICESCGKDIKEATHYQWVGHHKDHNRMNNTIENLILLCKRCHQIEHQCWKAFEGVTTIRKE